MKRMMAAALLVASAALLSGCSVICDFVIVNESGAPLEVRYAPKPEAAPPNALPAVPGVLGADKVDESVRQWRNVPAERYTIDSKTGHVWVKVLPGEALLVARLSNYSGHESQSGDSGFNIDSISLDGAKGSMKYQGRQALTQFIDDGSCTYVIRYR